MRGSLQAGERGDKRRGGGGRTTGVTVGLSQVEEPQGGGGAVLTFAVADIAAARAHLEGMDTRFDGPTQEIPGLVKLATFYDPDGNAMMLSQDLRG